MAVDGSGPILLVAAEGESSVSGVLYGFGYRFDGIPSPVPEW